MLITDRASAAHLLTDEAAPLPLASASAGLLPGSGDGDDAGRAAGAPAQRREIEAVGF